MKAVAAAEKWLTSAGLADARSEAVVSRLVELASHRKWEIRRAVATAAAQSRHAAFDPVLAKLSVDENNRVCQAAQKAMLRRRDWASVSALGAAHEAHLNAVLDDIEGRFGHRGRAAVKGAAEQLSNVFARETYHELIKVLDPLAKSAERLRLLLSASDSPRPEIGAEAERIESRVARLHAFLEAMRSYAQLPADLVRPEELKEVLEEAASLVVDRRRAANLPSPTISVTADATIVVELSRTRLLQALTNLFQNAVESYDGLDRAPTVDVSVSKGEGYVSILVVDSGCGMTDGQRAEAKTLFATNKPNGTGFGLPLAVKIIESEHEGRLELESDAGRGTVVRVTIPLKSSAMRQNA